MAEQFSGLNVFSKSLESYDQLDFSCSTRNSGYTVNNGKRHEQAEDCGLTGFEPSTVARALRARHAAGGTGQEFSPDLQIQEFLKWCEECGEPGLTDYWDSLKLYSDGTAEHQVRYDVRSHRAVKKTLSGNYGFILNGDKSERKESSLLEYLDRLALQNELFGDEILVIGGLPAEPSMILFAEPTPPIVTSQPFRDGVEEEDGIPSETQVSNYMEEMGFTPLSDAFYGWCHQEKRILVVDAKPDNFVLTADGVKAIDLQIRRL